jgi:hypothetical protein
MTNPFPSSSPKQHPSLLSLLLEDNDLDCFREKSWIVMEERRGKEGCVGKECYLSF